MELAILKGLQGESVIVSSVPYAIGRCRSADLIIAHVNVSRNHCKILKEKGLWKIQDFSSSGTFVNDNLVGQEKAVTLKNGDRIRFGPFESNICWTFYSSDISSESSTESGVPPKSSTFPEYDEKHSRDKQCSSKGGNVSVTFKENEMLRGAEEILKNCDLKCKWRNEKLFEVKQQTQTSNALAQFNEEYLQSAKVKNVKEKGESEKIEELTKELQSIRKTLSNLEEKNCSLQRDPTVDGNIKTLPPDVKLLENLADLMEAEFQCTICSELFVTAVTLSCSHTFCKHCINQWKKKQKTCPICRKKITNETQSLVVDNYIDKMVGNLSLELKERREAIIKERKEIEPCRKRSKLKK